MSEDKPSAFEDARKGLGLLFRAARTVARKLPTVDVEEAVTTSAREVGRAIENVATTIERAVLRKDAPESAEKKRAPSEGEGPGSEGAPYEPKPPADPK